MPNSLSKILESPICTYDGEQFTYPRWVIDICAGISTKEFSEKYPAHFPKIPSGLGCIDLPLLWCWHEMNLGLYPGNSFIEIRERIQNNDLTPFISLVFPDKERNINYFVRITRGHTNNQGEYRRGLDDTTDITWRNDMVCLANAAIRYQQGKQDKGSPTGTKSELVDLLLQTLDE